jgi:hypothetical protein
MMRTCDLQLNSHGGSYASERIGEGGAGVNLPAQTFILA